MFSIEFILIPRPAEQCLYRPEFDGISVSGAVLLILSKKGPQVLRSDLFRNIQAIFLTPIPKNSQMKLIKSQCFCTMTAGY